MLHSLSPATIYTQFYDGPLPERNVNRLLKWNKDKILKLLISLKIAHQQVSRERPHNLITMFLAFLPSLPSKYGPVDRNRITSKTVLLQIIADLLQTPDNDIPDSDLNGEQLYRDIVETILIYNDHQFVNTGIRNGRTVSYDDVFTINLMQELNAENPATYTRIGGIKQLIYLEFLKQKFTEGYPAFVQAIKDFTGLNDILETALLFIHLHLNYEDAVKQPMPIIGIGSGDPRYELLQKLELVIDASSGTADVKLPQLFTSPFLKLKDGFLYLLGTSDFDLITTKSWNHFLVSNKLFESVLPKVKKISDLNGLWGKEYVESFLALNVFKSLSKNGLRVLESDDQNLPDATIIVNERDVFVIEIKSISPHHKITSEKDIAGFQKFIQDNFATGKKGVPQLNRNIKYLSANASEIYRINNPTKKLRIYPIIVYTDPHFTKQGVNDYINATALPLSDDVQSAFQSVEQVTLIPMDFFLENLRPLQEDRSLLRKLITEYHGYVRKMKKSHAKNGNAYDYLNAMTSFETWSVGKYGMYREDPIKIFDTLRKVYEIK